MCPSVRAQREQRSALQSHEYCRHREPWGETVKAAVQSQQKFPEKIETHSNTQPCHTSVFTGWGVVLFVYVHSMPGEGVHEN